MIQAEPMYALHCPSVVTARSKLAGHLSSFRLVLGDFKHGLAARLEDLSIVSRIIQFATVSALGRSTQLEAGFRAFADAKQQRYKPGMTVRLVLKQHGFKHKKNRMEQLTCRPASCRTQMPCNVL